MIESYRVRDKSIQIDISDAEVFQPHPITLLMAESIVVHSDDSVLELGAGSGLVAITAAKLGARRVTTVDISERAVKSTLRNAQLNNLNGEFDVLLGDYFKPVHGNRYDVIVSNPPCMPFPSGCRYINRGLTVAVNGGHDGTAPIRAILSRAKDYLHNNGRIYMPIPKWSNWKELWHLMDRYYHVRVIRTGEVPYFLSSYDSAFERHIQQLRRARIVDVSDQALGYVATILIVELRI